MRDVPPKRPLKGLLLFRASGALSGSASLAPLTASLTPDTASEGLAGATSSSLSLAPAAHARSFRHCGVEARGGRRRCVHRHSHGRTAEEAAEGVAALRGVCSCAGRIRCAVRQGVLQAGRRVRGASRRELLGLVLGAYAPQTPQNASKQALRQCERARLAGRGAPPKKPLKGLLLAALGLGSSTDGSLGSSAAAAWRRQERPDRNTCGVQQPWAREACGRGSAAHVRAGRRFSRLWARSPATSSWPAAPAPPPGWSRAPAPGARPRAGGRP